MGLLNSNLGKKILNEILIDIIEWLEEDSTVLAHRYPREGNNIRNGAKLTVREGQVAVFVNEGQIADVFQPGMYELSTENLPILSSLKGWKYGFKSPFKAEVYFINTRIVPGFLWGTPSPFILRDPEFGVLKLTSRGHFSIKVSDPGKFITGVIGTEGTFTTSEIEDRLRKRFVTEAQSAIAEMGKPFYEMAEQLDDLSAELKERINQIFIKTYGVELDDTSVQSIDLTPESMQKVEKRDDLMFQDNRMDNYERMARADALKNAAANPGAGGLAAGGMGLGMGLAMANQMGGQFGGMYGGNMGGGMAAGMAGGMAGAMAGHAAPPPPPPGAAPIYVMINNQQAGPFPPAQIAGLIQQGQVNGQSLVWKQGMAGWAAAGSVAELAGFFSAPPPPPPAGAAPPPPPASPEPPTEGE